VWTRGRLGRGFAATGTRRAAAGGYIFVEGFLAAQQMVVVLPEAVRLVADLLQ